MPKKRKNSIQHHIPLITAALIVGLIIGIGIGTYVVSPIIITNETIRYITPSLEEISDEHKVMMNIVAVDENNDGVIGELTARVRKGSGLVLVSINDILAEADTQQSARTAAKVAGNYSGVDLNQYDIIYSIKVNASVIGGPSAGSAMAIATALALGNNTINPDVIITGSINSDGTIGPAGEIAAKASAARQAGATTFLVPLGHTTEFQYVEREYCETYGSLEYCQIEYIPERINIGEKYNITLIEVQNIGEALEYFAS